MTLYKNAYRAESHRKKGWDYGSNAFYFVTICTHQRLYFFGDICNNIMKLSEIGEIAEKCWLDIPVHFPFVILHSYVVMPNHIHGIIEIAKIENHCDDSNVDTQHFAYPKNFPYPQNIIDTQDIAYLQYKNKFGPQSKNLASIIRGFKIGVTKNARIINPNFSWQRNYHDHIIRNSKSYENIANYITNNHLTWDDDTLNPKKQL
jgi:REP element-mobilizing transposase RayT